LAEPELLNAIVQTLKLRFSDNGACNATVGAPLVLWQVSTPEILELRDRHYEDPIGVVALLAKRTFWEKATILHAEYYRPAEKALPDRYSRHYYDVAMLAAGPIRAEALADMTLLAQVVRHKEVFYPSAWAHYAVARPGSLRLLPADGRLSALERDYRNMGAMIFGKPPAFDKILQTLATLEEEINK
jgi:hypothetical protein